MNAKRIVVGMLACLGLTGGLVAGCPPEDCVANLSKVAKELARGSGDAAVVVRLGDQTIDLGKHLHAMLGRLHDDVDVADLHRQLMRFKGDLDVGPLHEQLMRLKDDFDIDSLHDHMIELKENVHLNVGGLHTDLQPVMVHLRGVMQPESKTKSKTRIVTKGDGKETANIVIAEDEDTFTIKLEDGKVTSVERNGKKVDPENIRRKGDRIEILDDGKVVYSFSIGDSGDVWVEGTPGTEGKVGKWSVVQAEPPKAMIGVQLGEPDGMLLGHFGLEPGEATLITGVYEGFPADKAGLEPYDIVVAVDGKTPAGQSDLREALRSKSAGDKVELTVIHRGERKKVEVKLVKYDQEALDKAELDAIEGNAMTFTTGRGDNVFVVPGLGALRGMQGQDPERWREFAEQWRKQAEEFAETFRADPNFKGFRMDLTPPTPPAPAQGNATERLEERLERLEKMIERLAERLAERGRSGR